MNKSQEICTFPTFASAQHTTMTHFAFSSQRLSSVEFALIDQVRTRIAITHIWLPVDFKQTENFSLASLSWS